MSTQPTLKTFLIKVGFFLLPIFLIAYPADRFITRALWQSPQGLWGDWNELYAGNVQADIAIYGSSRAAAHISSKILEDSFQCNAFNLGIFGHFISMQYARHKIYTQHNPPPKFVVLCVDLFSLVYPPHYFNYEQFFPFLDDSLILSTSMQYPKFDRLDMCTPLYRYAGEQAVFDATYQHYWGNGGTPDPYYKGFVTVANNRTYRKDKAIQPVKEINQDLIRLFESLLQELQQKEIGVLLVYTPEYVADCDTTNKAAVLELYHQISNEYQIPFVDYSADPNFQDTSMYADQLHLHQKDAERFTREYLVPVLKNYYPLQR